MCSESGSVPNRKHKAETMSQQKHAEPTEIGEVCAALTCEDPAWTRPSSSGAGAAATPPPAAVGGSAVNSICTDAGSGRGSPGLSECLTMVSTMRRAVFSDDSETSWTLTRFFLKTAFEIASRRSRPPMICCWMNLSPL